MKAFYDALEAMIPPELTVHLFTAKLSVPPVREDFPYVVFGGDAGWEFSGDGPEFPSLDAITDSVEMRIRATVAGTSPTSLDWALQRVRPYLTGKRPVVPGFTCSTLDQAPLLGIQPDRDISLGAMNPLLLVDEYVFTATRI